MAITRARGGVIIIGHLPTMMAATTSGFPSLLDGLWDRQCIFSYAPRRRSGRISPISSDTYQALLRQAGEGLDPAARGPPKVRLRWADYTIPRPPTGDAAQVAEAIAQSARRHITTLASSGSFLAAMAHTSSLRPRANWAAGHRPDEIIHWDRKSLSHENFLTHQGVNIDCGNQILGIMFLALRQALTVDPPADQRDTMPLPLGCSMEDMQCQAHPVLTASVSPGLNRRPGPTLSVTLLLAENIPIARCLQMVIATLLSREPQQQTSKEKPLNAARAESHGDVLEAAGGMLAPWGPAVYRLQKDRKSTRLNSSHSSVSRMPSSA